MKINSSIIFTIFIILFLNSNLNADTIFFDSKNIKIEDNGNMLYATKGEANIPSKNVTIKGNKFIYDKKNLELIIIDDVKYFDKSQDIYIESEKIIYKEVDDTIFSKNETYIKSEDKYEINSYDVLFDRSVRKISSNNFTKINDKNKNKFILKKGFLFELISEIISSKEANVIDKNLNSYFFENSMIDLKNNEIVGREIFVDFENSFFGNEKNDPVLKGRSMTSNDKETKIYKTVFSTCNKKDKNCRGWEMQSQIFTHNKIKKLFEYEKSWLKVFDKKVFYMPYFNHPDPSVKRKTGFLPDNNNSNSHFFATLDGAISENTNYELKVQHVSNDNYLKIHDIKGYTPIIESDSLLTSYLKINKDIDNNTDLQTSVRLYENLAKGDSDRYQYIFPNFDFNKEIDLDEQYNGRFNFLSSGFQKLYDTNKYEALINNDFNFKSFDYITTKGLVTNYNLLLKNYNTYSENSSVYENKNDHEIFGTFLLKSEYPLKKELEKSNNYFKPVTQIRFSPTNGKDISDTGARIQYNNIFSSNRIGRSDMVEKGKSITLGVEFEKQNLENEKIFGINIGNVLKDKKNESLPDTSKLDQTRSDIVGSVFYKFQDHVELNYNFSYDRDLDFSNYDALTAKLGLNKLVTTFNYITENHEIGNSETLKNTTSYRYSDEHSVQFDTTKDLKDDFTQFYKLSYEYETDCLLASFQYQKKFFRNGRLQPDESLFFLIKFIPFAELRGSANTIFENNE